MSRAESERRKDWITWDWTKQTPWGSRHTPSPSCCCSSARECRSWAEMSLASQIWIEKFIYNEMTRGDRWRGDEDDLLTKRGTIRSSSSASTQTIKAFIAFLSCTECTVKEVLMKNNSEKFPSSPRTVFSFNRWRIQLLLLLFRSDSIIDFTYTFSFVKRK